MAITSAAYDELRDTLEGTGLQIACIRTRGKHWWSRRPQLHELPESDIRELIRLAKEADQLRGDSD